MLAPFILLASAPLSAMAAEVLKTNGYSSCQENSDIKVNKLDIEFDRSTKKIRFDVSGSSEVEQKVMAVLVVNAYGKEVYRNEFNPCEGATKMDALCPGMCDVALAFELSALTTYLQYPPATLPPLESSPSPNLTFPRSLPSLSMSLISTARLLCS